MDLSGHEAFRPHGTTRLPDEQRVGRSLLVAAWAALASPRTESVAIHLRHGLVVECVLDLRIEGSIAEAATRTGQFTHMFAVEDVVMIRRKLRGGMG